MNIEIDREHEEVTGDFRRKDPNHLCMLTEAGGINEGEMVIDTHWHEWMELTYVTEGSMTMYCEDQKIHVNADEIICVGVQSLHQIIGDPGKFSFRCFHINIGFIMQNMNVTQLYGRALILKHKNEVIEQLAIMEELMEKKDQVSQMRYKASLLILLSWIAEDFNTEKEEVLPVSDTFSEITYYLIRNYKEDISLNDLAEQFDYTPQYISNLFKKYMNTTFLAYLTKLRIDHARFLLMSTEESIANISYACGFSSENAMIDKFKKRYGLTPLQYRKKRTD